MVDGDIQEEGAVMAGQIAPLVKEIRPVADIIDSTIVECKQILDKSVKFKY